VVLVSHDRYLLEACVDRLWRVADGNVTPFDGDLDDYRKLVLAGEDNTGADRAGERPARLGRAELRRVAAEKRVELAPLQRQIKTIEATMARDTARIAEIDRTLADPQLYVRDALRAAALNKERAEAVQALAVAEEQWLALSSSYEGAMAE
jgi:ATP-binding cassette subfamily F protein 3